MCIIEKSRSCRALDAEGLDPERAVESLSEGIKSASEDDHHKVPCAHACVQCMYVYAGIAWPWAVATAVACVDVLWRPPAPNHSPLSVIRVGAAFVLRLSGGVCAFAHDG